MNLKAALLCSVGIHGGLLALRPAHGWVPPRQTLHTIEVVYEPAAIRKERTTEPVVVPTSRPITQAKSIERISATGPVAGRPSGAPPPGVDPPLRGIPAPPVASRAKNNSVEVNPPISGDAALPAESFALFEHQRRVKEHLRSRLVHPGGGLEGTVHLRLTLGPQGTLEDANVLASSSGSLAQAALEGAWAAIPYPKFPQEVAEDKLQYEFLVQYRPE